MDLKYVNLPEAMTLGELRAGCDAFHKFLELNKEALKDVDKGMCEDIFWAGVYYEHSKVRDKK